MRTAPNTMAVNLNVKVEWWDADRMWRSFMNIDESLTPRYVPTKRLYEYDYDPKTKRLVLRLLYKQVNMSPKDVEHLRDEIFNEIVETPEAVKESAKAKAFVTDGSRLEAEKDKATEIQEEAEAEASAAAAAAQTAGASPEEIAQAAEKKRKAVEATAAARIAQAGDEAADSTWAVFTTNEAALKEIKFKIKLLVKSFAVAG